MKTLQIAFLALITTTLIISCKKDSGSSNENNPTTTDSGPFTNSYYFASAQASINGIALVFDQFSKKANILTAKAKQYFKREPSATFNDSTEYILEFEIVKSISKVGDYSVTGPEVKTSFSWISSNFNPVSPFTYRTVGGTIHVTKVDQTTNEITGTFDWEGQIVTATPYTTNKLIDGHFVIKSNQ